MQKQKVPFGWFAAAHHLSRHSIPMEYGDHNGLPEHCADVDAFNGKGKGEAFRIFRKKVFKYYGLDGMNNNVLKAFFHKKLINRMA